jgi:hypothetical protein
MASRRTTWSILGTTAGEFIVAADLLVPALSGYGGIVIRDIIGNLFGRAFLGELVRALGTVAAHGSELPDPG